MIAAFEEALEHDIETSTSLPGGLCNQTQFLLPIAIHKSLCGILLTSATSMSWLVILLPASQGKAQWVPAHFLVSFLQKLMIEFNNLRDRWRRLHDYDGLGEAFVQLSRAP